MIGNADKLLKYPERLESFWAGEPVIPITVEIHPVGWCNQKCVYCNDKKREARLSRRVLRDTLKQLTDLGVEGVVWSGGEPTLCSYLFETISEHGAQLRHGLITNGAGVKFKPDELRPFDWVRFSVDTFRRMDYERLRGTDQGWLIRNIRQAVCDARTVGVQRVFMLDIVEPVMEFVRRAKALGVDYVQIRPREDVPNPAWMTDLELRQIQGEACPSFSVFARSEKTRARHYEHCAAASFRMTIRSDGSVLPCACSPIVYDFGNVNDTPLAEIVTGVRRTSFCRANDVTGCPLSCVGSNINESMERCGRHRQFL